MHVEDGRLRAINSAEELKAAFAAGFQAVPAQHWDEAEEYLRLSENCETVVDLKNKTPLTSWAKKERQKKRRWRNVKRKGNR